MGDGGAVPANSERLLAMLEQLLGIEVLDVREALSQAAQLIGEAMAADKVDIFLYQPTIDSLEVLGVSDTPMSRKQLASGLDRMPLSNGGHLVDVYRTGQPFATGHAEREDGIPPGLVTALGVRSIVAVPLVVGGERQGVLQLSTARPEAFGEQEIRVAQMATRWVGVITHHAQVVEQVTEQATKQGRRMVAEDLANVLAHDLHDVLTPLKWHLQLLARRAVREQREKDIQDLSAAVESATRLTRLVANLLEIARLDRGIFVLTRVPVNVCQVVRETVALYAGLPTTVQVQAPPELLARADPDRLRQAIDNMLANAIRISPPGRPVTVRVTDQQRPDGAWVVITVRDHGPGIAPELLPRLFERFATGDESVGLGLGLYVTRRIAEAHDGVLRGMSVPGDGARFELTFPAGQEAE
jgi:two-component system OmpR family sensor kinase